MQLYRGLVIVMPSRNIQGIQALQGGPKKPLPND